MFPTRERVTNCQNYTFCYSYFITSRSNYLFHSATKRKFHWQDGSWASAAFLGNQSWKYDRHIVEPLFWNTVDPSLSLCWDTLGSRFAFCYEAVRPYGSTLPLFNGSLSLSGRFAYDLSPLAAGHYVELLCSVVRPYLLQVQVLVWMVRRFCVYTSSFYRHLSCVWFTGIYCLFQSKPSGAFCNVWPRHELIWKQLFLQKDTWSKKSSEERLLVNDFFIVISNSYQNNCYTHVKSVHNNSEQGRQADFVDCNVAILFC